MGRVLVALSLVVSSLEMASWMYRVARGYENPGHLPVELHTCDRDWRRSDGPFWTGAQVARGPAWTVRPGPLGYLTACPTGGDFVPAALFVRVGEDEYAVYELRGGP